MDFANPQIREYRLGKPADCAMCHREDTENWSGGTHS